VSTIYPDARSLCGEVLEFKTKKHKRHVCINGAPHSKEKHRCECGVKWTQDATLAAKPEHGEKWSSEQVIFQAPSDGGKGPVNIQQGQAGPRFSEDFALDPTKNYDCNDDKKSNYN
jgi:hypothetical protein